MVWALDLILHNDFHYFQFSGVISNINTELAGNTQGRLFAQIHVCGKQFKVTPEDLITLEGQWAPDAGERIKLEKVYAYNILFGKIITLCFQVLLVGGENFTLIGQPVLPPGLVSVEATVVEKTITHTKFVFKKKRRENYIRTHCKWIWYIILPPILTNCFIFQCTDPSWQSSELIRLKSTISLVLRVLTNKRLHSRISRCLYFSWGICLFTDVCDCKYGIRIKSRSIGTQNWFIKNVKLKIKHVDFCFNNRFFLAIFLN